MRPDQRVELARQAYLRALAAARERPTRRSWLRLLTAARNLRWARRDLELGKPPRASGSR
jgi:hypothetical protein